MPTYEYACQKCGDRIEVFQSFSAKSLKKHKECGGDLQKVFHASGIVFKGSGFYVTDSKRSGNGGSTSATAPSVSSSDSKGESSSSSTGSSDTKTSEKTSTSKEKATAKKATSSSDD